MNVLYFRESDSWVFYLNSHLPGKSLQGAQQKEKKNVVDSYSLNKDMEPKPYFKAVASLHYPPEENYSSCIRKKCIKSI